MTVIYYSNEIFFFDYESIITAKLYFVLILF